MSVIDILVEPARVTRILFDCHEADPDPADQRRIEQAIKESPYLARADENDPRPTLLLASHVATPLPVYGD
jgi:hypothetical protein